MSFYQSILHTVLGDEYTDELGNFFAWNGSRYVKIEDGIQVISESRNIDFNPSSDWPKDPSGSYMIDDVTITPIRNDYTPSWSPAAEVTRRYGIFIILGVVLAGFAAWYYLIRK